MRSRGSSLRLRVHSRYAQQFNRRYKRCGYLWFTSRPSRRGGAAAADRPPRRASTLVAPLGFGRMRYSRPSPPPSSSPAAHPTPPYRSTVFFNTDSPSLPPPLQPALFLFVRFRAGAVAGAPRCCTWTALRHQRGDDRRSTSMIFSSTNRLFFISSSPSCGRTSNPTWSRFAGPRHHVCSFVRQS